MNELIIHEKKISDKHNDSYHYGINNDMNLIAELGNYYVYVSGDRKYYDSNGDVANIKNDDDIKNTICESNNWFNIGTWEDIKNGNSEIEHTYDESIETLSKLTRRYKMQIEKANWYDYKPSDDNNGYIHGIHYIRDEEIEEVEWFKSKAKRDKDFNECIKLGYKPIN